MNSYQRYTNQLLEIKGLLKHAKDEEVIERLHDLAQEAVEYLEVPFEYTDGNGKNVEIEWDSSGCEWQSSGC